MKISHDGEVPGEFPEGDSAPMNPLGLTRRGGIAFFWVLNGDCDRASLIQQLDKFQEAGTEGLILHPRNGLLVPYGGADWFELIGWLVKECEKRGIEPILYDEDPYPSGNASGRVVLDRPEFLAHEIQRFWAPESLKEGELFLFPAGRLCWAGIVFPEGDRHDEEIDHSARVGMIRCHWEKAEWNSRWYYPGTPIYPHPRAFAHHPEFGLRSPKIPEGGRLVAFVARPVEACNEWGTLVDSLNPEATQCFLDYTHEQYRHLLGDALGKSVRAIFTDEPKPHSNFSWTPDLFYDFSATYGYDLRPKLNHLFERNAHPEGMRVRLDYRGWIMNRFDRSWMQPVAEWCHRHQLDLIGHLSPEEDPVNQAATIGNYFPPQKHLQLSGYDLIIPAIGDARHPLLNIGAVISASSAQQGNKPGVCCESLGAFGVDIPMETIGRTLAWQVLHGTTLGVIHGAFSSQVGLRRYEAPDDYGTGSAYWDSISEVCRKLTPFFQSTVDARQEAPVAILWPIRSYQALGGVWQTEDAGMRRDLLWLLQTCLESQVGIHFVDEADLASASARNGKFHNGRASYQWILVPSALVIDVATQSALCRLMEQGVDIAEVGERPAWVQTVEGQLMLRDASHWPHYSLAQFESQVLPALPKLVQLPPAVQKDFHVTVWESGTERKLYLMHMGEKECMLELSGEELQLAPGDLLWLKEEEGGWRLYDRFSPSEYPNAGSADSVIFLDWEMQTGNHPPVNAAQPLGVWQLLPTVGPEYLQLITTGGAYIKGGRMTEPVLYRARLRMPDAFGSAILLVEPTLMRGRFTLESGGKYWSFSVSDTDHSIQHIDLSEVLKPGEVMELCFTLHEPEAMDGIKHSPQIQVMRSI